MMDLALLQRWIGLTGLSLPILLILTTGSIPPSMSATYYGPGHDAFVSALAVIGGGLGAYRGHDAVDRRASILACLSAFGVAIFPMSPPDAIGWPYWCGWIHFLAALVFFGALASISGRLFVKTDMAIPGKQKLRRNFVYRLCACTIVIGVAALAVVAVSFDHSPAIFWVEAVMVWAFGIAYTVKSGMIRALND